MYTGKGTHSKGTKVAIRTSTVCNYIPEVYIHVNHHGLCLSCKFHVKPHLHAANLLHFSGSWSRCIKQISCEHQGSATTTCIHTSCNIQYTCMHLEINNHMAMIIFTLLQLSAGISHCGYHEGVCFSCTQLPSHVCKTYEKSFHAKMDLMVSFGATLLSRWWETET